MIFVYFKLILVFLELMRIRSFSIVFSFGYWKVEDILIYGFWCWGSEGYEKYGYYGLECRLDFSDVYDRVEVYFRLLICFVLYMDIIRFCLYRIEVGI